MKTVKRNLKGEITHILVGCDMMKKEEANKVLYNSITSEQILTYLRQKKLSTIDFIRDVLNEKETIHEMKKRIMGFKKIGLGL